MTTGKTPDRTVWRHRGACRAGTITTIAGLTFVISDERGDMVPDW